MRQQLQHGQRRLRILVSFGIDDHDASPAVLRDQHRGAALHRLIDDLLGVPAGNQGKGLGTGHWHGFVPLWLQKSVGPWSSYGGGGYWINPGAENRNYWLFGWQAQRYLSELATVGAEIFYGTADQSGGRGNLRFNLGVISDLSEHHHLLLSLGRSIVGDTRFQSYLAYQLTI